VAGSSLARFRLERARHLQKVKARLNNICASEAATKIRQVPNPTASFGKVGAYQRGIWPIALRTIHFTLLPAKLNFIMDKSEYTSEVSGLTSKSFRKEYGSSRSIPARYLAYNPYSFISKTEIKILHFPAKVS
jgi:hypothetical protein